MKLSTRDKNLIVFVICAAIIVLAYLLGYQKITEMNDDLTVQNENLEKRKIELEEQLRKKDDYEENIVTKTLEYNKLLSEYPEGINQENQYQFLLQLVNSLRIESEDLTYSMSQANEIYDFPEIYTYGEEYSGIMSELTLNFRTTYEQYKAFLKYIETCENEATPLYLTDGTTLKLANGEEYKQEWPVHKTYIVSTGAEVREEVVEEELVTYIECFTTMRQLAVTSADRIYLNPTIVDIPGYQPPLSKKNIFAAEDPTAIPEPETDADIIKRAKATFDIKIDAEAGQSTVYMHGDKGELQSDKNKQDKDLYLTIEEGGSAGLYFVTYSFGEDAYAKEDKTGVVYKRMAFMPQENIDIVVSSDARYIEDAYKINEDGTRGDKVAIKQAQDKLNIHINNKTEKQVELVIIGKPAASLEGYTDKFEAGSNDGLQYVNADITYMTGSVEIKSLIEEEVKALTLLPTEENS